METKELRIGNLVYSDRFKKSVKVNEVSENYVIINDGFYAENLYLVESIPLTEEWLLKFDENNKDFMVDKVGFVIFKNSYAYQFIRDDYKYVHQLQNLYYALTGEELTIKDK